MSKTRCHVISNTHWDREWRYPFQSYRMDLVDLMDEILELMEKRADYRAFFLDSQTVILEDYLEIRPENEVRIRELVHADRLQIGPWYTLPDQWGCPGEALVRNLLVGHQVAHRFGKPTKVGYTPFSNGQISQLPQIYRGFGLDSVFFYRGIGKHIAKSEFIWEGVDGSRVFGFKFGDYARYNYYYLLYRPGLLGRFPEHRDYPWIPEEVPYRVAVEQAQDRQYGWIDQKLSVHKDALPRAIKDCRRFTEADATTSELLYMMGHDHSFGTEAELDLVNAIQEHVAGTDEEVIHSALNDYMEAFRKAAPADLQVFTGEMRHTNKIGLWTNLMGWILSCRLYLKQRNARVCNKLINTAEPMATIASLTGTAYPAKFMEIAWKKILVNHAHDAIGGCSVDQVHQEMLVRFNDIETISDEVSRRSMRDIVSRIDGSAIDAGDLQLTVFNTLPAGRDGIGEFIIDLPRADAETPFTIQTLDGRVLVSQVKSREPYTATIEGPYELTLTFDVQRCHTFVELPLLPAMGYEALVVRKGIAPPAAPRSIVTSDNTLENELLGITVNSNGTFDLVDKRSGQKYQNLASLEDTSEFGDPWNRVTEEGEAPITSLGIRARIEPLGNGPLAGTIRCVYTLPLPASRGDGKVRSSERVDIPVTLEVTLRKGSPYAEATLRIDNRAMDHRLRVLFPSRLSAATHAVADGQFDVISRQIQRPDATGWKEAPYPTNPMWSWVDVSDGEQGLAVFNDGLIEQEVTEDPSHTIAITLLRAFGKFIYERPTPGSQCLGTHVYRFAVMPHAGDWKAAELTSVASRFLVPHQALLSAPSRGSEPPCRSFFELSPGSLVFSAVKPGDKKGAYIFRFWNPLEESVEGTLAVGFPVKRAELMTLEEIPLRDLVVTNGSSVSFRAEKKKIITICLYTA